jgi:hypothetical protein
MPAMAAATWRSVRSMTVPKLVPEERFAYLDRDGAHLMIEQPTERALLAGELDHPYGRGMNLQIEVGDVDALYAAVIAAGAPVYLRIEERWYRRDHTLAGNRQFIVQGPDGYLLRLYEDLGRRPAPQGRDDA